MIFKQLYFQKLVLLFVTFFKISLLVVGGGLVMLPVIEETFVRKNKFLMQDDILDMIVLTQTVPGLIAVNASVFVGNKIAGFVGSIVALVGVMLPSLVIIMLIAAFFPTLNSQNPIILHAFSSIRACITGVFIVTAIRLYKKVVCNKLNFIIVFLFVLALIININPAYVILFSMPLGCVYLLWEKKCALTLASTQKDATND